MVVGASADTRWKRLTRPSWIFVSGRWLAGRASLRLVRRLWKFLEQLSTWFLIFRLGAKKDPTMSGYSLKRATRFCARRGWRSCMITLLICGSMLTSVAFGREHILLGFDSLVLSGPDIPSGCFDPHAMTIIRLAARILDGRAKSCKTTFRNVDNLLKRSIDAFPTRCCLARVEEGSSGRRSTAPINVMNSYAF